MKERAQTRQEELANALTHGLGIVLCVLAMPVVLTITFNQADLTSFYGIAAFAVGVLLVYSSSTLYHFELLNSGSCNSKLAHLVIQKVPIVQCHTCIRAHTSYGGQILAHLCINTK